MGNAVARDHKQPRKRLFERHFTVQIRKFSWRRSSTDILPAGAVVVLQILAGGYFVADALADETGPASAGSGSIFEVGVALALLAGIALGVAHIVRLARENRMRENALAVARGALSRILVDRFARWGLSSAEADVALFALKGCTIAQIADLRDAAQGTVRAQLSQVYTKAGVSSQPMLMSLFLDDLMSEQGLDASD
ncbi:MAG: hypothetical protein V4444_02540 [Pseudomonadota bacterium]